jgi:hypothetical protein
VKKLLFALLAFFIAFNLKAQDLRFEKSFQAAQNKSASSGKPLFVLVHAAESKNALQNWGFLNEDVLRFFDKNFICYKYNAADSAFLRKSKDYTLSVFPAYLFFDPKGNLIHRADKKNSNPQAYLDLSTLVLQTLTAPKNHSYYAEKHTKGLLSQDELKRIHSPA